MRDFLVGRPARIDLTISEPFRSASDIHRTRDPRCTSPQGKPGTPRARMGAARVLHDECLHAGHRAQLGRRRLRSAAPDQRNGPQDIDPSAAHWIHGTVASGGGNRLLIRMRPSASLSLAARGS
jgi:hypothetical protein